MRSPLLGLVTGFDACFRPAERERDRLRSRAPPRCEREAVVGRGGGERERDRLVEIVETESSLECDDTEGDLL